MQWNELESVCNCNTLIMTEKWYHPHEHLSNLQCQNLLKAVSTLVLTFLMILAFQIFEDTSLQS